MPTFLVNVPDGPYLDQLVASLAQDIGLSPEDPQMAPGDVLTTWVLRRLKAKVMEIAIPIADEAASTVRQQVIDQALVQAQPLDNLTITPAP